MPVSRAFRRLERLPSAVDFIQSSLCPTRRRLLLRTFCTSSRLNDDTYNHPKPDDRRQPDGRIPLIERVRVVPASPSYFGGRSHLDDLWLQLEEMRRATWRLPRSTSTTVPAWRTLDEFNATLPDNQALTQKQYTSLTALLQKLSYIHPAVMPAEVRALIAEHTSTARKATSGKKHYHLDEWGRALGVGRRKTSTAKAYLVPGEGKVLVNGKSIVDYFGRIHDRESALWALKVTGRLDQYNVFVLANGGGVTGQAEATTIAVAKALRVMEPFLSKTLALCKFFPMCFCEYGLLIIVHSENVLP